MLIDLQRILHPKAAKYTILSSANGTFSSTDHILGPKTSLSKFKKIEIVWSILSDHNAMRLDINYGGKQTNKQTNKPAKNVNSWRLNNTLLNNKEFTEELRKEIKRKIKKFLETNDNENLTTQNLWDAAKAVLGRKFIVIQSYLKKQEKHQIDNLTLHLKQLEKEEQNPPKLVEGKKS